MESTHDFVEKIHDIQDKAERNKRQHGKGTPSEKLPTKQHGTKK